MNDNSEESNVVPFNGVTRLNLDPKRVLAGASSEELEGVVVIGWCKDGDFYFASSLADGGEVITLCEMAKYELLKMIAGDA